MKPRASWSVLRSRMARLAVRSSRYMALKRAGVKLGRIFRSGGLASVLHGARVVGVPTAMLEKARAVNGQALAGAVGSKSRTL
eukprot:403976-Pyramimonas_sp.AAC.1